MLQIKSFFGQIAALLGALFLQPDLRNFLDIIITAFIIYQVLKLISHTRASSVFKGIVFVILISLLAEALQLTVIRWVLSSVIGTGVICLVILFQPELRRVLEQLGRSSLGLQLLSSPIKAQGGIEDSAECIDEIVSAVLAMSKKHIGALILFEGNTGLKDVMETGTYLGASITSALIQNIFEPNTPLHDGATIIKDRRIISSACFLQLSENSSISKDLGTRHRAAIGITETTDCISLIVSEETGVISYARNGKLTRYLDEAALRRLLEEIFARDSFMPAAVNSLLARLNRKDKADV